MKKNGLLCGAIRYDVIESTGFAPLTKQNVKLPRIESPNSIIIFILFFRAILIKSLDFSTIKSNMCG